MAGIIKKFSDYVKVSMSNSKKILCESATADKNAYTDGTEIKTWLTSEGYMNESQFTADETVLIREAGGAIVDYAYSNFTKPSRSYFGGGFITKSGSSQITTDTYISCVDDTGSVNMTIASGFIKELSNAWAAGSGAAVGALDTGVFAAFKMYSIYIIAKVDGTSDLLCVEGGNTPTMPTDYTVKREIARIQVDRGSVISKIYNFYDIIDTEDLETKTLSFNYFEGFEFTKYSVHGIFIWQGACKDDTNEYDLIYRDNNDKIAKEFDAAWVAGDSNGMLDTGAIADKTQYYVYMIFDPTTGAIDFLSSLSATSPTMPSGFTIKRLIGFIRTIDFSGSFEFLYWNITEKWEDVNMDIGSFAKENSIIASAPTSEALFSGDGNTIKYPIFDSAGGQDHYIDGVKEYPHAGRKDMSFHFHAHFYPEDNNTGDIVMFLDYIITAESDSVAAAPTRFTETITILANNKGEQQTFNFDWVYEPTISEGDQISFTFGRESTSGSDTYVSKIAMATFGFHYLKDKKGSDMEISDL